MTIPAGYVYKDGFYWAEDDNTGPYGWNGADMYLLGQGGTSAVIETTWLGKPYPWEVQVGTILKATDYNNSLWYNNGQYWQPFGGRQIVAEIPGSPLTYEGSLFVPTLALSAPLWGAGMLIDGYIEITAKHRAWWTRASTSNTFRWADAYILYTQDSTQGTDSLLFWPLENSDISSEATALVNTPRMYEDTIVLRTVQSADMIMADMTRKWKTPNIPTPASLLQVSPSVQPPGAAVVVNVNVSVREYALNFAVRRQFSGDIRLGYRHVIDSGATGKDFAVRQHDGITVSIVQ